MRHLAIETSCDDTSVAVFEGKKILSHLISSQVSLHLKTGGVVPEVASRAHLEVINPMLDETLRHAQTKLDDLDAISVTAGPGLLGSLLVGVMVARTLGTVLNKPVLPINHLEGHLYANFKDREWPFPALSLIVSGGHTFLALMNTHGDYKILGETQDDAAGEAFDKVAKLLGLGYPGGPAISKIAESGNDARYALPRGMARSNDYNFSFSGLKTAVLNLISEIDIDDPRVKADLAASFQRAAIDSLIIKTERAIKEFRPKALLLGGGVAANELLRREAKKIAKKHKITFSVPEFKLCTDNAAMIGLAAYYKLKFGIKVPQNFDAKPVWSLV